MRSFADVKEDYIVMEGVGAFERDVSLPPGAPRAIGWDDKSTFAQLNTAKQLMSVNPYVGHQMLYDQQPKRTAAMVKTLNGLAALKQLRVLEKHTFNGRPLVVADPFKFKHVFLLSGASHLKESSDAGGDARLNLDSLRAALQDTKAVILFPKGLLQSRFYS